MDVSDIFYFFRLGEERGSPRRQDGGGGSFFIENPRRGGGGFQEGPEGVSGESGNFWGGWGGLDFFFPGPNCPSNILDVPPWSNSVHTRCIVKTSGFTRGTCKNHGFFIKFKGLLVDPEKIKKLRKIARKVDFSEPLLLQCT